MKVSFYKEGLGWHGRADVKGIESICIEFGGKKVYVFNNKQTHTVGVNIFDFSKGQQKILSFNEPQLHAGYDDVDDHFDSADVIYTNPFPEPTKEELQAGRKSLDHGKEILTDIQDRGFYTVPAGSYPAMPPGKVEVIETTSAEQVERVKRWLRQLGIPIIEVPLTKEQFNTAMQEPNTPKLSFEQEEHERWKRDQRG